MTVDGNCPFCNAVLPPLPKPAQADKLPCPRCGELVPAAKWRVDAKAVPSPAPKTVSIPRANNRKTALVILGIMLAMAALGLSYALWTLKDRQARHPWMPKKLDPVAFRRPLELTGLGYLPKDCKIVAALHVAEMVQDDKSGKKLLAEPRPGVLDWPIKQITRTSGLTLEEIDHVVLGTADLKQVIMAVKARGKISLEKIADARPTKSSKHEDRPVYEFAIPNVGPALVWCVDDETLVYVLRTENLDGFTAKPRAVDEVLPAPLREVLGERLPKQSFMWVAGRIDQLGPIVQFLPVMMGMKADLGFLKETKTLALALTPHEDLTLVGEFHMIDAKSAAKLKTRLDETRIEGATSQKAEATPPAQAEQWVSWQVRGDAPALRAWLGEAKEKK